MKHANWIREHLCDVHMLANGQTGGWTVKTWVHFCDSFITTEHVNSLPPSMDEIVEAVLLKIQTS